MTKQAQNSLTLFKGENPGSIKQALTMQKASIVDELKQHFNTYSLDELALRLSLGK